jgi:hypothetical protein
MAFDFKPTNFSLDGFWVLIAIRFGRFEHVMSMF